jgi:transcriptional regulator of heat shock response
LNDIINIIKDCKKDILQLIDENEEEEEIEICLTRENSSKSIYDNFLLIDSENENN